MKTTLKQIRTVIKEEIDLLCETSPLGNSQYNPDDEYESNEIILDKIKNYLNEFQNIDERGAKEWRRRLLNFENDVHADLRKAIQWNRSE